MKENSVPVTPVVCCVCKTYVICIPAKEDALISVLADGRRFTSDDNGVLKSSCTVHKIEVPMDVLDRSGGYTVEYTKMLDRRPYRSQHEEPQSFAFRFRPIKESLPLRVAHLSDVHGLGEEAIKTGSYFNDELDLLILNGDISSSSQSLDEALLPLQIAYAITKGERPCIITRGNHDLRGIVAERLGEIYPTDNGRMYYTVTFRSLRFIVLDCGEDKVDAHIEYGGTAAFHQMRLRETVFLKSLAEDKTFCGEETPLIVLSHIPFPHTDGEGEFAIEQPVYTEWCDIIKERLQPVFCLFGHHHQLACMFKGDPFDTKGINAPMILGGKPVNGPVKDVHAAFLTVYQDHADLVFSDKKHRILNKDTIQY